MIEAELPSTISMPDKVAPSATANLQIIRSLNLLALGNRMDVGDSIAAEGSHDIARLEAKVDLILSIVGSLVAEKISLPPVHLLQFSAESVTIYMDECYTVGQSVVVTLFPDPQLPHPLEFAARVREIVPGAAKPARVGCEFDQLDPVLKDEFERYIFLRHRREHSANSTK